MKNNHLFIIIGIAVFGGIMATTQVTEWWMVLIGLIISLIPTGNMLFQSINLLPKFITFGVILAGFELAATQIGWPYGKFSYTDLMQPLIWGLPVLMVVIWPTILLGAKYVADKVLRRHNLSNLFSNLVLTVLLVVGYDLVMDPGAVSMGLWVWDIRLVEWFGVPPLNYFGWAVFGIVGWGLIELLKIKSSESYVMSLIVLISFWTGYVMMQAWLLPTVLGCLLLALFISTTNGIESKVLGKPTKL